MGITQDFEVDLQTIRDYVNAMVEIRTRLAIAYTNALASLETDLETASPAEASPDYVKAVVKAGLKSLEKTAIKEVKDRTNADLGPLADMVHAIADEAERAARASAALPAARFINSLRAAITNAYTRGQTGEDLRLKIEAEYKQGDEGQRGGYIAGIENELDAVKQVEIPAMETLQLVMLEGWINQAFTGNAMEGPGIVLIRFDGSGAFQSAGINAPLGDRISTSLNEIMTRTNVARLMNLDVVKKVCLEEACMCFEGDNVVRKGTDIPDAERFLTSENTWDLATRFTT